MILLIIVFGIGLSFIATWVFVRIQDTVACSRCGRSIKKEDAWIVDDRYRCGACL